MGGVAWPKLGMLAECFEGDFFPKVMGRNDETLLVEMPILTSSCSYSRLRETERPEPALPNSSPRPARISFCPTAYHHALPECLQRLCGKVAGGPNIQEDSLE